MEKYLGNFVKVTTKGKKTIQGILGVHNTRLVINNARIDGSTSLDPCFRVKVEDVEEMQVLLLKANTREFPSLSYDHLEFEKPLLAINLIPNQSFFSTSDPSPISRNPGGFDFGVMNQNFKPYQLWNPEAEDTEPDDNIDGSANTMSETKEEETKPTYLEMLLRNPIPKP